MEHSRPPSETPAETPTETPTETRRVISETPPAAVRRMSIAFLVPVTFDVTISGGDMADALDLAVLSVCEGYVTGCVNWDWRTAPAIIDVIRPDLGGLREPYPDAMSPSAVWGAPLRPARNPG